MYYRLFINLFFKFRSRSVTARETRVPPLTWLLIIKTSTNYLKTSRFPQSNITKERRDEACLSGRDYELINTMRLFLRRNVTEIFLHRSFHEKSFFRPTLSSYFPPTRNYASIGSTKSATILESFIISYVNTEYLDVETLSTTEHENLIHFTRCTGGR